MRENAVSGQQKRPNNARIEVWSRLFALTSKVETAFVGWCCLELRFRGSRGPRDMRGANAGTRRRHHQSTRQDETDQQPHPGGRSEACRIMVFHSLKGRLSNLITTKRRRRCASERFVPHMALAETTTRGLTRLTTGSPTWIALSCRCPWHNLRVNEAPSCDTSALFPRHSTELY